MRKAIHNGSYDLPPHSIEAEKGVLGSILLSPNDCLPEARSKLPTSEVFYDLRHRGMYECLCEMDDKRIPIDSISIQQRLRDSGSLESFGGIAYLSSLPDEVPSAANLGFYVAVVLEKYQLRRTIQFCTEQIRKAQEHAGEIGEFLDGFETEALRIRVESSDVETDCKSSVLRCIDLIERCHSKPGTFIGLPTGFRNFDDMTGGLVDGDMVVIAGRPSLGKSSLAMNFVENIAIGQRVPVGVFSLEMTKDSLIMRMLGSRARVNMRRVTKGVLFNEDFPKLQRAAAAVSRAPIQIDPTSGLTIQQLRARARRLHQQFGVKLLIVDYLQIVATRNHRNHEQAIAEISTGIKNLAKELNIPVIAISQLSRDYERDKERKPRMSDLRASGQIEQDADLIGILYRTTDEDADVIPVNLMVCKQRNGDTGDVHFRFHRTITRFEEASRIADEDVPEREPVPVPYAD